MITLPGESVLNDCYQPRCVGAMLFIVALEYGWFGMENFEHLRHELACRSVRGARQHEERTPDIVACAGGEPVP